LGERRRNTDKVGTIEGRKKPKRKRDLSSLPKAGRLEGGKGKSRRDQKNRRQYKLKFSEKLQNRPLDGNLVAMKKRGEFSHAEPWRRSIKHSDMGCLGVGCPFFNNT